MLIIVSAGSYRHTTFTFVSLGMYLLTIKCTTNVDKSGLNNDTYHFFFSFSNEKLVTVKNRDLTNLNVSFSATSYWFNKYLLI